MARPVARGRLRGLSRLTAPTHGAAFWLALWAAAAAASVTALIPVLFDRGPPVPGHDVIHIALRASPSRRAASSPGGGAPTAPSAAC